MYQIEQNNLGLDVMLEDTPASTLPVWLEFSANSFQLSHLGGLKVSNDFHPVKITSSIFSECRREALWQLFAINGGNEKARLGILSKVIWLTGFFCGSRVPGTNVRCELLVALLSEFRLHLVDGIVNEQP